jgi:hypothetical protein
MVRYFTVRVKAVVDGSNVGQVKNNLLEITNYIVMSRFLHRYTVQVVYKISALVLKYWLFDTRFKNCFGLRQRQCCFHFMPEE